jgi:hypothetical protein
MPSGVTRRSVRPKETFSTRPLLYSQAILGTVTSYGFVILNGVKNLHRAHGDCFVAKTNAQKLGGC